MFFSVILSDVPNITYVISIISIFFQQKSTVIGFISFDGTKINRRCAVFLPTKND